MKKMNKILIIAIFLLLFSYGCAGSEKQEEYNKCTSVCAAVVESPQVDEGFVTLELCRQECKKKFLEEE